MIRHSYPFIQSFFSGHHLKLRCVSPTDSRIQDLNLGIASGCVKEIGKVFSRFFLIDPCGSFNLVVFFLPSSDFHENGSCLHLIDFHPYRFISRGDEPPESPNNSLPILLWNPWFRLLNFPPRNWTKRVFGRFSGQKSRPFDRGSRDQVSGPFGWDTSK